MSLSRLPVWCIFDILQVYIWENAANFCNFTVDYKLGKSFWRLCSAEKGLVLSTNCCTRKAELCWLAGLLLLTTCSKLGWKVCRDCRKKFETLPAHPGCLGWGSVHPLVLQICWPARRKDVVSYERVLSNPKWPRISGVLLWMEGGTVDASAWPFSDTLRFILLEQTGTCSLSQAHSTDLPLYPWEWINIRLSRPPTLFCS